MVPVLEAGGPQHNPAACRWVGSFGGREGGGGGMDQVVERELQEESTAASRVPDRVRGRHGRDVHRSDRESTPLPPPVGQAVGAGSRRPVEAAFGGSQGIDADRHLPEDQRRLLHSKSPGSPDR